MTINLGIRSGFSLLNDECLFIRIATRIARENNIDRVLAGKMLDQAVIFTKVAGDNPGMGLSPSEKIDKAWYAFILYTPDYTAFCQRVCRSYVHHTPNDNPMAPATAMDGSPILTPTQTAELIRDLGYNVIWELWPTEAKANCTNCYSGDHVGKPPPS